MPRLTFLVLILVCSLVLLGAVNFATNCIAFWEPGTTSAFPFMVVQLTEFARYPLTLYGWVVRALVTWVVPVAFCSYYPGALLLGKAVDPSRFCWARRWTRRGCLRSRLWQRPRRC